jgi:hypothetical protein
MEQMMEHLLAKMVSNQKEMKADMKTQRDSLASRIDYNQEKSDADLKETKK